MILKFILPIYLRKVQISQRLIRYIPELNINNIKNFVEIQI